MTRTERAEMVRLMASELTESVKTYETVLAEHNGYACAGVNVSASDTKTAVSSKIRHMRQTLLDLEGKL